MEYRVPFGGGWNVRAESLAEYKSQNAQLGGLRVKSQPGCGKERRHEEYDI